MTSLDHEGRSLVMQYIGRRYVGNINAIYGRTGTLWQGRHTASLIDSERYLLTCMRYIEMNPVRANLVALPEGYKWSSYHANALGVEVNGLTAHDAFLALGNSPKTRQQAYRELFKQPLMSSQLSELRECLNHVYPLVSERFRSEIQSALKVNIGRLKQGRPRPEGTDTS